MNRAALESLTRENGILSKRKDPRRGEEIDIFLYTYKHANGICYLYENQTTENRLEEIITFRTKGLEMIDGNSEVIEVILEPGEQRFIEFKNTTPRWSIQTSVSYSIS